MIQLLRKIGGAHSIWLLVVPGGIFFIVILNV